MKDNKDFERFYSRDIPGVENRLEDDLSDIHRDSNENIVKSEDGRYEVKVPWVPGSKITKSNEAQSKPRLKSVERKLDKNAELKRAYQDIVETQLQERIIEKVL